LYVTPIEPDEKGARTVRLLTPASYQVGGHVGAGLDGPGITWSPNSSAIAFTHSPSPLGDDWVHADVAVVDINTGTVRPLLRSAAAEGGVVWSPDGNWIAVAVSDAPATYALTTRIHVVSPVDGTLRPLAESFDQRPSLIGWSPDSRRVIIFEGRGVGNRLSALPLDGSARVDLTPDTLLMGGPALGAGGSMIGFTSETPTRPAEAFVARIDNFAPRRITALQPRDLPAAPRTEAVRWKSPDGIDVEGLLTYPVGWRAGNRVPLLVILHGGPPSAFTNGYTGRLATYPIAVFAQRGFAVLRPNVRGSAGYGRDFRYANVRDWGGGDARDVVAGVEELVARGIADSARVGVMGWSYGGYLTAITIARTTRFRAASVGAGITDLVSFSGTADIPGFVPSYYGGDFWDHGEAYRTGSAIANIARINTPTLIQHGELDERVPIGQGYQLYYGLKRRGIPVRMLVYPRTRHGIGEPKLQMEAARANLEWFERWLR
jgi:dipeptidyl aminopeptidase/acylaminoacyl peptidase